MGKAGMFSDQDKEFDEMKIISKTMLFRGLDRGELSEIKKRGCLKGACFTKDELIFSTGDKISEIGIVVSGSVNIENIDIWGNKSILGNFGSGQVFAETYAVSGEEMMVDAVAAEDSSIVFLDMQKVSHNSGSSWYPKLIENLLRITSQKNLILSERIFCTSSRSVRERISVYLSMQSAKAGERKFKIPFDRQQMADYLNVDRSALSKELGRMRDEGMITFHKNSFELSAYHI